MRALFFVLFHNSHFFLLFSHLVCYNVKIQKYVQRHCRFSVIAKEIKMGLFTKIFGTRSQREIKQIQPIVNKVLALENEYKNLSEDALKAKTALQAVRL